MVYDCLENIIKIYGHNWINNRMRELISVILTLSICIAAATLIAISINNLADVVISLR